MCIRSLFNNSLRTVRLCGNLRRRDNVYFSLVLLFLCIIQELSFSNVLLMKRLPFMLNIPIHKFVFYVLPKLLLDNKFIVRICNFSLQQNNLDVNKNVLRHVIVNKILSVYLYSDDIYYK